MVLVLVNVDLMAKISAGILVYKRRARRLEVLMVHPGGPFWRKKDAGAWSIPKGEPAEGEDLFTAARREIRERSRPRGGRALAGDERGIQIERSQPVREVAGVLFGQQFGRRRDGIITKQRATNSVAAFAASWRTVC